MLRYVENREPILWLLLAVIVVAIYFFCKYQNEKRKTKKMILDIKEERHFYQIFSEYGENGYLYLNKSDLSVLFVSENFKRLTGLTANEIDGDLEILKELVDRKTARDFLTELKNWDQQDRFLTEIFYKKKGTTNTRVARILIETDRTEEGYFVVFRDATDEYQERQQLADELEIARKQSQEKTDFLSKMSHEIRTPMNGILGMLNLAKAHLGNAAQVEKDLQRTEKLSQFLLQLINDILDMSRIESGKMELEAVPFDLFKLGEKLDIMFRESVEAKGVHWQLDMQDFKEHYVIGDEMRLSQVIVNFISNANKFTQPGGTVSVTFRQMDVIDGVLHFMICVRDTGKGIRADFIDKIFRPFEQEDASTARNYGGSGLGMAIADNIVKMMNGQILVDSEEGKGTEFSVYLALPVAESMEETENTNVMVSVNAGNDEVRRKAVEEFSLEGMRILMAEDNDINAEIAMEILKMQGAYIERACDGREAVEMFAASASGTYDLIFMDIQMPEMNGWEATAVIRQMDRQDADLPIFAMSANAFLEDQRHSLEVGMNGHINKPVDFDEIRRVVGECFLR